MGACCCCKSKVADKEVIIFKARSERKCTDCLFCIIFLAFWLGMIIIAGLAVSNGDPERLIYGVDYEGKICGGADRSTTANIYYPRITEDILNFAKSGETNPLNIKLFGICVNTCPGIGEVVCTSAGRVAMDTIKAAHSLTDVGVMVKTGEASAYASISGLITVKEGCWTVPLQTTEYFFRCLWQRNSTSTTTVTCEQPSTLRGVVIDSSTPESVTTACVTKRVSETTVTLGSGQDDPLMDQMFDTVATMGRYVSDVEKAIAPVMVCGGVLAIVLGFLWLLVIQRCGGCMVWTTIWLVILVLFGGTLYAYDKAGLLDVAVSAATSSFNDAAGTNYATSEPEELSTAEQDLADRWKWFAILLTIVLVVVVLLIVFMRSRIRIAVAMIKEAAKAIKSMPMIMFFPFLSVLFIVLLMVYWLIIAGFIYSNGEVTTSETSVTSAEVAADSGSGLQTLLCARNADGTVDTSNCAGMEAAKSFEAATTNDYLLLYHFFGLLWTMNFITGFFIMSIAGAVCAKYFGVRDKAEDRSRWVVWDSVKTTLLKHLGSVAFGSLIIAIVQLVRAILAYIDRKSKSAQENNMLLKYLFKCLHCCLWCFEKCVKYISTNAYIIVAMKGKSFCSAAMEAVITIIKNAAQVSVVNTITAFLFVLGKILITGICGVIAFLWLDNASTYQSGDSQLYSYWAPMLLIVIMSFAVATAFMNVLGIAIDTIVLCVCVDTQRTGAGSKEKPYYASQGMLKAIGISSDAVSYGTGFVRVGPSGSPGGDDAAQGSDTGAGAGIKML